jgi:glycosyltransferase involved in cell wall biosynthesis
VVPPGIDLGRFVSSARENESVPKSSASPHRPGNRPATIGTVARLTDQKGVDTLLKSALRIRARFPDLRVLIAGEGPLRADLEAEVGRLGLADAVCFLGHVEDVRLVYGALDVFVLASRHEGSPLALLEAMATGVPVVATRVSGLAEVVRDGTTGVLVEPEQPQALADAVINLLADTHLRRSLADAACLWVCAERSVEAMTRKIESIYASIASQPIR